MPVTAEDVRWTWIAQTRPEVAWESGYMKQAIDDVAAVDPHTVRFHFTRVYAKQLLDANEGAIYPKHAWEKLPFSRWREAADWFKQHLVVDGPYQVASWKTQQEIDLRANPRYFDPGRPYIDRVVWRVIPDQNSQIIQLLSGEIDLAVAISPRDAARVKEDPRLTLVQSWFRTWISVAWNSVNPLFADPEVRRALTLAIDRETIVKTLWGPYAQIADSPIVHAVWAHDPALRPWPYQPEVARGILARKGFRPNRDGVLERDGKLFSFELSTNAGNQQRADGAVMIQEQLRRIGVQANVRQLEFNTLSAELDRGKFDATVIGFTMDTSLDLTAQFHSRSIGANNITRYSNPEVDRLIESAMRRPDIAQSRAELDRVQELLHRDEPYTLLWESQRLNGANKRVRGVQSNSLFSLFNLQQWWLAPSPR